MVAFSLPHHLRIDSQHSWAFLQLVLRVSTPHPNANQTSSSLVLPKMSIPNTPLTLYHMSERSHIAFARWQIIIRYFLPDQIATAIGKDTHANTLVFGEIDEEAKLTMLTYVTPTIVKTMEANGWSHDKSAAETMLEINKAYHGYVLRYGDGRPDWFRQVLHHLWAEGLSGTLICRSRLLTSVNRKVEAILIQAIPEDILDSMKRSGWSPGKDCWGTFCMLSRWVPQQPSPVPHVSK